MAKSTIPPFFSWRSAFMDADLAAPTKHVLHVISTYMNSHGQGAFPTIETIAKKSGLSVRTVKNHIPLAISSGWLAKSKHGFKGAKWANNHYEISFPIVEERGAASSERGAAKGKTVVQELHTNTPSNTPKNIKYIKDFEELFIAYGKVGNRKLSMAKYQIARRTVDQETLLKAIKLYDAHLKVEDWKQKRSLQAWLHQEGWTEEWQVKPVRKSWMM